MLHLLDICFDSSCRLTRRRYCFEYRSVQFKLVQSNSRKWADHLLTIIPKDDMVAYQRAFSTAAEFVSALAWEIGARATLWEAGQRGWPKEHSLKQAEPSIFTPPRIRFSGGVGGYDLTRIAHVETEQQRVALALFREASASNNDYLSFLFYWQILETRGNDPVGFINKTFRKCRSQLRLDARYIAQLPLAGRPLGQYLLDDCRHAIAHIRRRPGKKNLDLDQPSERLRLTLSSRVIAAFARYYIREVLGLKNTLHLVQRKRGDIPVYADRKLLADRSYRPVPPKYWRPSQKLLGKSGGGNTVIRGEKGPGF